MNHQIHNGLLDYVIDLAITHLCPLCYHCHSVIIKQACLKNISISFVEYPLIDELLDLTVRKSGKLVLQNILSFL